MLNLDNMISMLFCMPELYKFMSPLCCLLHQWSSSSIQTVVVSTHETASIQFLCFRLHGNFTRKLCPSKWIDSVFEIFNGISFFNSSVLRTICPSTLNDHENTVGALPIVFKNNTKMEHRKWCIYFCTLKNNVKKTMFEVLDCILIVCWC